MYFRTVNINRYRIILNTQHETNMVPLPIKHNRTAVMPHIVIYNQIR